MEDFGKSAPQGVSASTCRYLSSVRFWENLQTGGDFLQAHVGICPVAEFGKSANYKEFLQAHVGNLGSCPVADFRKSAPLGEFLQAHVGICEVADFGKSANWGGGIL